MAKFYRVFIIAVYVLGGYLSVLMFLYSGALMRYHDLPEEHLPEGGGTGSAVVESVSSSGDSTAVRLKGYAEAVIPSEVLEPAPGEAGGKSADLSTLKPGVTATIRTWGFARYGGPARILGLETVSPSGERRQVLDYDTSVRRFLAKKHGSAELADWMSRLSFLPFVAAILAHVLLYRRFRMKKTA